jgi:hypothetical protein
LRNILVQEGDTMPGDRLELRYQKLMINGKNNSLDVVVSKGNNPRKLPLAKQRLHFINPILLPLTNKPANGRQEQHIGNDR